MAKKENTNEEVLINITGTLIHANDKGESITVTEKENPIGVPRSVADDLIRRGKAELHVAESGAATEEAGAEG